MANLDHFITCDGVTYAGNHVILDIWGAEGLTDLDRLQNAMQDAVKAAGATLLHIHLHHFGEGLGVSGVAVLAESHISVHTWPEAGYAAFDIFMCGDAKPELAVEALTRDLNPTRFDIKTHQRGVIGHDATDN